MSTDTRSLATACFDVWRAQDSPALRELLPKDPIKRVLATFDSREVVAPRN
jgi:hypothetical protein